MDGDIPIPHRDFVSRPLAVRPAGFFKSVQLIQGGAAIRGKKRRFEVRDDARRARVVELKARIMDPLPLVSIDDESIELGRPLAWYEYAWMGLPLLLIFVGGAIGGFLGAGATYASAQIFRSERGGFAKYALSALVSFSAFMIYLTIALWIQMLRG